ncbi:TIGR04282 family arsenosugar biosynthesis glycosyltransferase [Microbaculum marinum]|uniref:TIGR04282 family arsenosugar biosynthesis glycosyltransferase n=1 Tax=Microbaculum marinum TaxID=1764581 RepID=A0AAW9RN56_9HYPH
MQRWLVVMAKAPRAYAVKSRLAKDIGAAEATRFYRVVLNGLVRRVAGDPHWQTVLAVAPDRCTREPVWPPGVAVTAQGRGDLGRRMQRVMEALPPGPAIIVGSDIPTIRPPHLREAFRLLDRNDVVIGPAEDGGYWLVGLKRRPVVARIFAGVRWSTPHALADTLSNCRRLSVATAATLPDVDGVDDWQRWRRGG